MRTLSLRFLMLGLISLLPVGLRAGVIVDSVNAGASPADTFWIADEVGWFYTPAFSYTLTDIETEFGSSDGRTVNAQIWSGDPSAGGVLLGQGGFVPIAEAFAGANIGSVSLSAGHTYFVGFQNTSNLFVNVTNDIGATMWSPLHWSEPPANGTYSLSEAGLFTSQPIIEFTSGAAVPEPSTGLLLGLCLAGLTALRRVRA